MKMDHEQKQIAVVYGQLLEILEIITLPLSPPEWGAKYCNESVGLSNYQSVRSRNSKTIRPNFTKFLCMLPVVVARPPLAALRYVMYFRFYGSRHVFML